jgi:hypothetical protein
MRAASPGRAHRAVQPPSGARGEARAKEISLGAKWPPHLVPLCADERTNAPFPFVLDVAHLSGFSHLRFYRRPELIVLHSATPASTTSATPQTSSFAPTPHHHAQLQLLSSSAHHHHPEAANTVFEYRFRPHDVVGEVSLSGAVFGAADELDMSDPDADDDADATGESPARSASAVRLRLFRLRVPNHSYYLKPATLEQQQTLEKHLPGWISACELDVYNTPLCIMHVELTMLDHNAGNGTASDTANATGRRHKSTGRAMHVTQPTRDNNTGDHPQMTEELRKKLLGITSYRFAFSDLSTMYKDQYDAARSLARPPPSARCAAERGRRKRGQRRRSRPANRAWSRTTSRKTASTAGAT